MLQYGEHCVALHTVTVEDSAPSRGLPVLEILHAGSLRLRERPFHYLGGGWKSCFQQIIFSPDV